MELEKELLNRAYAAFNAREIDRLLGMMRPDVEWPNGWEGGWLHGVGEVRDYWLRQWAAIDPHVEPTDFSVEDDGRIAVTVHQVVKDLSGNVLADGLVQHVYNFENGLVRRMEIRPLTV